MKCAVPSRWSALVAFCWLNCTSNPEMLNLEPPTECTPFVLGGADTTVSEKFARLHPTPFARIAADPLPAAARPDRKGTRNAAV